MATAYEKRAGGLEGRTPGAGALLAFAHPRYIATRPPIPSPDCPGRGCARLQGPALRGRDRRAPALRDRPDEPASRRRQIGDLEGLPSVPRPRLRICGCPPRPRPKCRRPRSPDCGSAPGGRRQAGRATPEIEVGDQDGEALRRALQLPIGERVGIRAHAVPPVPRECFGIVAKASRSLSTTSTLG